MPANFEVLRLIGAGFETKSVVQTINKFSLYEHLPIIKKKHIRNSFQVIDQLLLNRLVYQVVN